MGKTGVGVAAVLALAVSVLAADQADLPRGVRAVWDPEKAWRESTPTRERVCLNGLWRWQPAADGAEAVPAGGWGFFKVPGSWPGITDYMQKDSQTVYPHPSFGAADLRRLTAAWYEREVAVPAGWTGRRIVLAADTVNSLALVYVDGEKAGEIRYPGGEADLTGACRPGKKHRLTLLVHALPLSGVMLSYNDTASAREVKGAVARRGLCGDVFLVGEPKEARVADVRVITSWRRGEITVDAALEGLSGRSAYGLTARVLDGDREIAEFKSASFRADDLAGGRHAFSAEWMPERLWDLHTPENLLSLEVALTAPGGKVLDAAFPVRFGFREFRIDGRDFVLNGTRIALSAVPFDNAHVGAGLANKAAARESLERLKSFGINLVYTHNYGCEPGTHLSFAEILDAADEAGVLVALSQPHFGHYDWAAPDADAANGYARHAAAYVRVAGSHPSVVAYAMSHNATGYEEDMNPDLMDGVSEPRNEWSKRGAAAARRAEAIVAGLDPGRIVYHHSSGNLGSMHTVNFYANFVPAQELSDWFAHWAKAGKKPVFLCEYGSPLSWDFAMYRGWYQGKREFGSATVPWELCIPEWLSQFAGDRAYALTERAKANLRWEAAKFRAGQLWHRWDYPTDLGSNLLSEEDEVYAEYIADNWRAFRTHGLSAFGPWDHGHYWRLRDGVDKARREIPTDWDDLQRPGFSPDYVEGRYERMDLAFERADWVPTAAGEALLRHNRPLLAYLCGGPEAFTEKGHVFFPGETVEKQVVIVNGGRTPVEGAVSWSFDMPKAGGAGQTVLPVPAGGQARIPVRIDLPPDAPPGRYMVRMTATFPGGEEQEDSLALHVVTRPAPADAGERKVLLLDPRGETAALLKALGVKHREVKADAKPAAGDLLVIGKGALTVDGPGPDLGQVREGLVAVVFEQEAAVLEKRLGFRVTEYGLRRAFPRVPDHPLLAGLSVEHLRDWRGEATLTPPRLAYESKPGMGPIVRWCDIPVTRVWRCGNRGSVASVLIEKPAAGDFLPVIDGGFSLQYSPLLVCREGLGAVVFCQCDVTGRTESEPAAAILARNVLSWAAAYAGAPGRPVAYAGEPAGLEHLRRAGFAPAAKPSRDAILVAGPGAAEALRRERGAAAYLAVGLSGEEARAVLPVKVTTKRAEHTGTTFPPPPAASPLAGVGPADLMNRDPAEFDLVTGGVPPLGDGVLAADGERGVVLLQMAPWRYSDPAAWHHRRTYRRASAALARILGNLGAAAQTSLLPRFADPPKAGEQRFLAGLYLDAPIEWDDPYRFFRW